MKAGRKRSSAANPQPSAAPEPAVSPHVARYASLALRAVATLLSFLNLCPLSVRPLLTDLDPSWVFGLNYAHIKGLVWGQDVAFTYGPWGFLSVPVNLGSNVDVAVACQLIAWLAALAPLWYLLCRKAALPGVVLFTLGTGFVHATITRFTSDEYLGFLSLLCLAAALFARRWAIPLAAAAVCAAIAMMTKFSTGVFCAAAVLAFPLSSIFRGMRQLLQQLAVAVLVLVTGFTALYFCHHASFSTMLTFLKLSVEMSDAYTVSQALYTVPELLTAALVLTAFYIAVSILLFVLRDRAAAFSLVLLPPLFIAFRHGFVRSDTHVGFFFSIGSFLIGLLCLIAEFRPARIWIAFGAATLCLSLVMLQQGPVAKITAWYDPVIAGVQAVPAELDILNVWQLKKSFSAQAGANLAPDRLPADLLQKVGRSTITVFPYELAYGAANDLNLVLMPLMQTYVAASAPLEEWNARLFGDTERRPEFLLMEWKSVDGRHPLLDVPATALAIYKWYDFDGSYGERILLRKRAQPRFESMRQIAAPHEVPATSIQVPQSSHPVVASIRLSLTTTGKLNRIFWKVPEVDIQAIGGKGPYWVHRAAPDALASPGPSSFMPFSLEGVKNLTAQNVVDTRVSLFGLTGPGLALYDPQVTVQFWEIPQLQLAEAVPAYQQFGGVPERGTFNTWRIDKVSGIDAASVKEVNVPPSQPYTRISGWAIDPQSGGCASAVVVQVDGTNNTEPAYGIFNPAIPVLFPGHKCRTAGFEWALPLSKGTHSIKLRILSTARDGWYTADSGITLNVPDNQ